MQNFKLKLTVIIPTYNEEKNIIKAVNSVLNYVDQVLVVDSFSTDNTLKVIENISDCVSSTFIEFTSFANKMNSALESDLIRNAWIMRLDADERVIAPETFFKLLQTELNQDISKISGYYINRRYYFLGKWIKYGGMYPRKVLRIFNKNKGRFESKNIDEKILIDGETRVLDIDIADDCQKGFLHWTKKHIQYAKLEAAVAKSIKQNEQKYDLDFDNKMQVNKVKYYAMPIFIRPALYFLYRIIPQKGVGDGCKGIAYHVLHAFIYRELVDFYIAKNKLSMLFVRKKCKV